MSEEFIKNHDLATRALARQIVIESIVLNKQARDQSEKVFKRVYQQLQANRVYWENQHSRLSMFVQFLMIPILVYVGFFVACVVASTLVLPIMMTSKYEELLFNLYTHLAFCIPVKILEFPLPKYYLLSDIICNITK